eukprot:CAMPEP_0117512132 /NCGR_PEP_ID=MMETSP0784-20121206/28874_1 /TAXON_ID=39447 /ORGANISM="" /LENGTH=71 /DNA_ID=CAMNT_0005307843 /DNA_START=35 /DNA_END=247 /DNA_ORIENTATION=+
MAMGSFKISAAEGNHGNAKACSPSTSTIFARGRLAPVVHGVPTTFSVLQLLKGLGHMSPHRHRCVLRLASL